MESPYDGDSMLAVLDLQEGRSFTGKPVAV